MRYIVLIFLFLLQATPIWGAVAYDSSTTANTGAADGQSTLSFSFDNVAGNYMQVWIGIIRHDSVGGYDNITASNCGSVTYNSVSMTRVKHQPNTNNPVIGTDVWELASPATGSHTVAIDCTDNVHMVGAAISFSGANTSTPIGSFATDDEGASATPSITVTSAVGEIVVAGWVGNDGTTTTGCAAGTGETERIDDATTDTTGDVRMCVFTEPGAASVVINPTLSGTLDYATLSGVSIKASGTTRKRVAPIIFQ